MVSKKSNDNRACALVRFSPRPLPEEARSLEVQEERIRSYADREGLKIVEVFRDPETSARRVPLAKREGGAAMLAYIEKHGIANVIIAKLDRAFRDTLDGLAWLKRWKKSGITLHLADQGGCSLNCNTATGELVMTFLLGVASFEPRQTAERTSVSMKHRQRHGQRMSGRLPYGYRMDGARMVECPAEQALGERMRYFHEVCNMSLRQTAAACNEEGLQFRGKLVGKSAVSAWLKAYSSSALALASTSSL